MQINPTFRTYAERYQAQKRRESIAYLLQCVVFAICMFGFTWLALALAATF